MVGWKASDMQKEANKMYDNCSLTKLTIKVGYFDPEENVTHAILFVYGTQTSTVAVAVHAIPRNHGDL